ncbi:lipopolysaccharide biosynthesis protein [Mesorhizobium muleiense]|uniref:lipopolysaccharide biosynthesis protein n=1 Tax=Mesorhizobium muleiense TaxID=1004279 RepID=UPI003AFA4BDA
MTSIGRVGRNLGRVASGEAIIAALGFLTLSLNTRSLGIADFGMLIVIQSVADLMNKFVSFQTWQAMTRFGAIDLQRGNFANLRAHYWFGLLLDTIAALIATALAIATFKFFGASFGLPPEYAHLGIIFAASGIFSGTSTSIGVMRLTDRFGRAILIQVAGSSLLLLTAIKLYLMQADICLYVYAIGAVSAGTGLAMILAGGLRVTQLTRGKTNSRSGGGRSRRAFLQFAFATSASGTLNSLRQRGELLAVAALLGPQAAGLYGVSYRLASLLSRFAEAGRQSIYPELASLIAKDELSSALKLVLKTSVLALAISFPLFVGTAMFGDHALVWLFGQSYEKAYPSLIWLMISSLTYASAFSLAPFVQMVRGPGYFLKLNILSFLFFVLGSILGPYYLRESGAGLGAATFSFALISLLGYQAFLLARRTVANAQAKLH